jgi:predicted O-methyltransferase YrrM
LDSRYAVDDFTQYQHIPVLEDADVQLNYCMPDEVRCIARLIKALSAQTVLEIGTQAGMTAYYLSRNLPPDGTLYTIDIATDMRASEEVLEGQRPELQPQDRIGWYYRARGCDNIVQIVGDSRVFNYADAGLTKLDLCFIDGNHTLDAVYRDVINVLRHMHPGSCLVWHDFDGVDSPDEHVKGAINQLISDHVLAAPVLTIAGTRVAYKVL